MFSLKRLTFVILLMLTLLAHSMPTAFAQSGLSQCETPVQGGIVSTANCLRLQPEGDGYRFRYDSHTVWFKKGTSPYLRVECQTYANQTQLIEDYAATIWNSVGVEFGDLGTGFYATSGSTHSGIKLPTSIIPADGTIFTRICTHITHVDGVPKSFVTKVSVQAGLTPNCQASVKITEAKKLPSGNVRVLVDWNTVGASAVTLKLDIFKPWDGAIIYTNTVNQGPSGSNFGWLILPEQLQGPGIYKVRVTMAANCGASSQDERPLVL